MISITAVGVIRVYDGVSEPVESVNPEFPELSAGAITVSDGVAPAAETSEFVPDPLADNSIRIWDGDGLTNPITSLP
jgi:hypothetical protein